ncbi:protein pitchfork isoform X1 [Vidua chalybeata]|nr:protein pitchfork isoform X1 [Vidua chalybeata]
MAARHDPKAVAKLISFGTTQERKMFPHYFAPDRLGIEVLGVRGSPFLGPGSYLGPQENIPKSSMSTRGYVLGARTAPRFQQKAQAVSPGPAAYGPFPAQRGRGRPAPVPFSSSSRRFPSRPRDQDLYPGPGTYELQEPSGRKFARPMKFGAPERAAAPRPRRGRGR